MAEGCQLYYITDRLQFDGDECARRNALLAKIAEVARFGIDYIQLREKDLSVRGAGGACRRCSPYHSRTEN